MLSVPTGSAVTARVATPLALSDDVPNAVAPYEKVTVPVGVPGAVELTVAVRVTDWLKLEGFGEEVKVAVVLPCTTT